MLAVDGMSRVVILLGDGELLNFPEKGKSKRQGDSWPNQRREAYFPYNVSLVSEESAPHI